ncbi:hypothetical protein [Undibacterium sp.]|jgi:hypothetical protein|uniref:hypothetical protein n=1 Tax=Undibacterium sp. TaxID=1914977 RepID=UPI0039C952F7
MSLSNIQAGRDLPDDLNVIVEISMNADPVDVHVGNQYLLRGCQHVLNWSRNCLKEVAPFGSHKVMVMKERMDQKK